jgi:hypothetical protein
MKYLTTLEVARELGVSKQTLLKWLYDRKVPEPPRNKKSYRLWSPSRILLIKKLISDGRLRRRTVIHKEPSSRPEVVVEFAREVGQFLKDAQVDPPAFLRELLRFSPSLGPFVRLRERRKSIPPRREPAASPKSPPNPTTKTSS